MLDTRRLARTNFIFYCGSASLAKERLPLFGRQFLVYGPIDGSAYHAVSFNAIPRAIHDLQTVHRSFASPIADDDRRFRDAVAFGKNFGPEFRMPAAICFLAALSPDTLDSARCRGDIVEALAISAAWLTDDIFPEMPKQNDLPRPWKHLVDDASEANIASTAMCRIAARLQKVGCTPMPRR